MSDNKHNNWIVVLTSPKARIVRCLWVCRSLRYLFKKLIFLVIVAMFKQENFIAPLFDVIQIFDEIGTDKFYKRNMRISDVLKLVSKLTNIFYRFDESEHDFKERFSRILNMEDLEKLLELRRKVDIRQMKHYIINLKATIRDLAEGVCPILDDKEMKNLHGSRYFSSFLYATCDFCGCQIDSSVNKNTFRECPDCMNKCQDLVLISP